MLGVITELLMNKQERFARGFRLIEDAQFVYDTFIPVASREKHWNIVVFESYRTSELLVKGIIYASGYEPKETHKLHELVSSFCKLLKTNKEKMAFVYSMLTPDGDRYSIRFIEGCIEIFKCILGSYTLLDSATLPNPYIAPKFKRDGISISIQQENETVLSTCDASLTGNFFYEKHIPTPPSENRINMLRELVETLLQTRIEAFYSEREFTEDEAQIAIENLQSVFQLSKAFAITDRI